MGWENLGAFSLRNASKCAAMLNRIWDDGDTTSAELLAQDYLGGPVMFADVPKVVSAGRILVYSRAPNAVVLCGGISDLADGLYIAAAYSLRVRLSQEPWSLGSWMDLAGGVMNILSGPVGQGVTTVQIAGCSAGGAVGGVLLSNLAAMVNGPSARLITFGAPRFANRAMARHLEGTDFARYFFPNDPVPYAPPTFTEAPLTYLGLAGAFTGNWFMYNQAGRGFEIQDSTHIVETGMPTGVLPIRDIALGSWILGTSLVYDWKHNINDYDRALQAFGVDQPQRVQFDLPNMDQGRIPPAVMQPLEPNQPTREDLRRELADLARASVARRRTFPPYYARRASTGYGVYNEGTQVCICTTRKKAQKMASGLNKAAAIWNRAPVGSQELLVGTVGRVFGS